MSSGWAQNGEYKNNRGDNSVNIDKNCLKLDFTFGRFHKGGSGQSPQTDWQTDVWLVSSKVSVFGLITRPNPYFFFLEKPFTVFFIIPSRLLLTNWAISHERSSKRRLRQLKQKLSISTFWCTLFIVNLLLVNEVMGFYYIIEAITTPQWKKNFLS